MKLDAVKSALATRFDVKSSSSSLSSGSGSNNSLDGPKKTVLSEAEEEDTFNIAQAGVHFKSTGEITDDPRSRSRTGGPTLMVIRDTYRIAVRRYSRRELSRGWSLVCGVRSGANAVQG